MPLKRIAVTTTGGDAPGMNAAIRAVVRRALVAGCEVLGIRKGFRGLFQKDLEPLTSRSVSNLINQGGTFLHTSRFPEFQELRTRKRVVQILKEQGIDGLVVIGGNGSAQGSHALARAGFPRVVVIPASIDNDLYGTDQTIGFDTAVNTAVRAIDYIRDTATSHDRIFIIEVMGRHNGFIALAVAVACGGEIVLLPEKPIRFDRLCREIQQNIQRGKCSSLIITAEGAMRAEELSKILRSSLRTQDVRTSVLGYFQRGGPPTAFSRLLATRFGILAIETLLKPHSSPCMVALSNNQFITRPLSSVVHRRKTLNPDLLQDLKIMST